MDELVKVFFTSHGILEDAMNRWLKENRGQISVQRVFHSLATDGVCVLVMIFYTQTSSEL